VKLEQFTLNWWRLLCINKYESSNNQTQYACYELIVRILQDVGIVKKKLSPSSYFPDDLVFGRLDMETGYHYGSPIYFDADAFLGFV
jgi:hypothetical protein